MIAKFVCTECGKTTEVEFDPSNPKENAMITLRLYVDFDENIRRKCEHCGATFSIVGDK